MLLEGKLVHFHIVQRTTIITTELILHDLLIRVQVIPLNLDIQLQLTNL